MGFLQVIDEEVEDERFGPKTSFNRILLCETVSKILPH